ncbi:O-methyltransferase [Halomonas sp. M4R1S46]|uniref:O-methyltransferase n=1 Tax=Halomonas sp. M4R1S46 TaxID=2982692 RepID=UPI0021E4AAFA|nr:class I SAM-dependent methyltransferase [Halomonas sp. M4R1S46]UYG08676.1 class I SAM-dependent methyltransferase [Halomonas sp. M4R1S46]
MHEPGTLSAVKAELEAFGAANDQAVGEGHERMLNITPATGEFLGVLVRATGARQILEVGTSNGYSTLWLAEAALATGGRVTTVEWATDKWVKAGENFAAAGVDGVIESLHADAEKVLERQDEASLDLIFLDADRARYPGWWPMLRRVLCPGGLLVMDNATSHAEQVAPFVALVEDDPAFVSSLVPVGKGELLATRVPSP